MASVWNAAEFFFIEQVCTPGKHYKNCNSLFVCTADSTLQEVLPRPKVGRSTSTKYTTDEIAAVQEPNSVVGQCLKYGLSYADVDNVFNSCYSLPNKGNFKVLVDAPVPAGTVDAGAAATVVTGNEITFRSAWRAAGCFSEAGRVAVAREVVEQVGQCMGMELPEWLPGTLTHSEECAQHRSAPTGAATLTQLCPALLFPKQETAQRDGTTGAGVDDEVGSYRKGTE